MGVKHLSAINITRFQGCDNLIEATTFKTSILMVGFAMNNALTFVNIDILSKISILLQIFQEISIITEK